MIFAWNKFEVLKKSPELAKLHLATVWEAVPTVLSQNKGPHFFVLIYIDACDVIVYNFLQCLCSVSHLTQTNN